MDCILETLRRFEDWIRPPAYVTVQQSKNFREEWLARSEDLNFPALLTAGEIAREGTDWDVRMALATARYGVMREDMRRFRDKIRTLRGEAVNEPVTTEAMDRYAKAAEDARMHYQAEPNAEAMSTETLRSLAAPRSLHTPRRAGDV
jgi:hypothetical protein